MDQLTLNLHSNTYNATPVLGPFPKNLVKAVKLKQSSQSCQVKAVKSK